MYFRSILAASALLVAATLVVSAQPVFRGTEIFPADEFASRREKVMLQIGDAAAIVLGATEPPGGAVSAEQPGVLSLGRR